MSDYDEGYRAGMQKMREVGQRRIEELELAVRYEADLAQQALDAREELEAKLSKAFIVLADLYRLHLRRGPAWDHAGTKEVINSACAIIAELSKERSDEKGQDDEW